jgi:hypothetical protein
LAVKARYGSKARARFRPKSRTFAPRVTDLHLAKFAYRPGLAGIIERCRAFVFWRKAAVVLQVVEKRRQDPSAIAST